MKAPQGFAAISREKNREIARQGGIAAHQMGRAHEFTAGEAAREAGKKGGQKVAADRAHMGRIGKLGGTKVSANREHMAAIGRKGGASVASTPGHMSRIGSLGGAVISSDREHMSAIGKKGGAA